MYDFVRISFASRNRKGPAVIQLRRSLPITPGVKAAQSIHRACPAAVLTAVAIAVLALQAPVAFAHRVATSAAERGMVYEASGRYWGGVRVAEPRHVPLKCFVADTSTLRGGGDWGAWGFSSYAQHHLSRCRTANGIVIEHRIAGRWYVVSESSDGYPPTHRRRLGTRVYLGVPRPIAKDLLAGLQ
jgi:hypothetical protein